MVKMTVLFVLLGLATVCPFLLLVLGVWGLHTMQAGRARRAAELPEANRVAMAARHLEADRRLERIAAGMRC